MTKTALPAAFVLLAACATTAAPPPPEAHVKACPEHDLSGDVVCYGVDVAENPDEPDGRRLSLEVMVLEARAAAPAPDPLVVIPGGPGQSATRSAGVRAYFGEALDGVRETRDVILIAPRGTAGSDELALDPSPDMLFASPYAVIPPEWADAARDRLAAQADLTQYTTGHIVDDLDATRRALGYAQMNLYGTSYGTRVAQAAAERYPDAVRSVILKAPVPNDVPIPLNYTTGSERALRRLFALCAAEAACAAAYPNLGARFDALTARLAAAPVETTAPHPSTGEATALVMDDRVFGYLVRNLLMSASSAATTLAVIDLADGGDFSAAAMLLSRVRAAYAAELAGGMSLSVMATEDAPRVSEADLIADAQAGFMRGAAARGLMDALDGWPSGVMAPELTSDAPVDVPALIVAGDLDPATPPAFAVAVAARFPNSRTVVFPGGAHSAANFGGLDAMMAAFLETADPGAVDVSAAEKNTPPPLAPPN